MASTLDKIFAKKPDLVLELFEEKDAKSLQQNQHTSDRSKLIFFTNTVIQNPRTEVSQINMHVSSKHLTEASPYFDALLNGGFSEGNATDAGPLRRILLKGINPAAFALLMDILHLRTKSLANQSVDSKTLYQVCVLIDMYGLHEQALLYTDKWFDMLKAEIQDCASEILDRWIFVAYVLRKASTFKTLTCAFQQDHIGTQYQSKTPLPSYLEDSLQTTRNQAFSECIKRLQDLLAMYEDTWNIRCLKFLEHCDALVLGALIRSLKRSSLYPPSDEILETKSIGSVLSSLNQLETPSLCGRKDIVSHNQFGNPTPGQPKYSFGTQTANPFGSPFANQSRGFFGDQFESQKSECGVGSIIRSIASTLRSSSQGISLPDDSAQLVQEVSPA